MTTAVATVADPSVCQVSGRNLEGLPILSVLARRTYRITAQGTLDPHGEPTPLVTTAVAQPDHPDLLAADCDLWPCKLQTDVVILGHAYGEEPQFRAGVTITDAGGTLKLRTSLLISGERRASLNAAGAVEFTPPAPPVGGRVALTPLLAYGGHDLASERELGNPLEAYRGLWPEIDPATLSPFRYPRNPWGRGYVVRGTREAVAAALLPQIEDPHDAVTPARLIAERPARWLEMPLPACSGWLPYGTFVRLACLRQVPHGERPAKPIAEVANGWLPGDILDVKPPTATDAFRLAQGAWPALRAASLTGGETLVLERLHRRFVRLSLTLPAKRPDLRIDGRQGRLTATKPVLHTVLIEPDEDRVTLVWRGSERALRPYSADELVRMPFVARFP
jgi:hypothetical protein